jgi:Zn-dependent protease with chaperone function
MNRIYKSFGFKSLFVLGLLGLCYLGNAHASTVSIGDKTPSFYKAPPDIQQMYNRILAAGAKEGDISKVHLVISNDSVVNAYMTNDAQLTLDVGILNFAIRDNNDEDMLAGTIGHELTHWLFGHTTRRAVECSATASNARNCEREADINGVKLSADAGYDCNEMANLFVALNNKYGEGPFDPMDDHPQNSERIKYIHKACAIYKATGISMPVPYETVVPDPVIEKLNLTDKNNEIPELK